MTPWMRSCTTFAKLRCSLGALARVRWSSSVGPVLTADPTRALMDEQIRIRARHLPPLSPVTLWTQMYCEDGDLWQSYAHYNTNSDGSVNLCRDASVGGSYVGCEPMGLFWALQPAPGGREGLRLRKRDVQAPYVFNLSVSGGHVSPDDRGTQGSELASVSIERWYMAPGVKRMEIREHGLVGTLFIPPGPGPFPAVLDLWGMGGGLVEYRSALLASKGYASFSLAYFGHKNLPGPLDTVNVGNWYFKKAYQFLQNHDQICGDRIGVIGLSYGVYLTLRIATLPGVEPSCCICINGPVGSTISLPDAEARTEPFEFNQKHWTFDAKGQVMFKEVSRPDNILPENVVEMEKLSCPVLFIVGEDDTSAASTENADLLEETLKAADKGHLFTRLSYTGAGHLIEPPYAPNARVSLWRVKPKKLFTLWGGHVAPHAAAQEDTWRKMLEFMDTHLRGDRG
uniref:Uncharacterized protein n=1 Tax=Neogobius melanostomus TaxID=47308 RepID=A0A8C6V3Z5_9GOBI